MVPTENLILYVVGLIFGFGLVLIWIVYEIRSILCDIRLNIETIVKRIKP